MRRLSRRCPQKHMFPTSVHGVLTCGGTPLAADVVLFRNPFNPAINPLADAELYMSEDAAYTATSLGAVNTGIIGMREGQKVSSAAATLQANLQDPLAVKPTQPALRLCHDIGVKTASRTCA